MWYTYCPAVAETPCYVWLWNVARKDALFSFRRRFGQPNARIKSIHCFPRSILCSATAMQWSPASSHRLDVDAHPFHYSSNLLSLRSRLLRLPVGVSGIICELRAYKHRLISPWTVKNHEVWLLEPQKGLERGYRDIRTLSERAGGRINAVHHNESFLEAPDQRQLPSTS